jgi:hypothetical protein
MNERQALIVLPAIEGNWGYSTAVVFEQQTVVKGWKIWIESIFNMHPHIERPTEVPPVRDPSG